MKRCPTCQRTYADNSLVFCLQDGAPLLTVGDASASFDSGATLVNAPPDSGSAQTEILHQPAAPTIASPRNDSATVPQQRITNPSWSNINPHPTAAAAQPAARNRALTVGVFVIAILLLGLVGIGVALLLQRTSSEENEKTANANSKNDTANKDESANVNENATGNANTKSNANSKAAPSPSANNSAPAVKPTPENDDGPSRTDSAARAEAKILANTPLAASDLAGLSPPALRRLRNTIYARHGRTFITPEIQSYFNGRPWYRPRSDYSDDDLTSTDRANISLIQAAESGGE
jgi:hypothetical protein